MSRVLVVKFKVDLLKGEHIDKLVCPRCGAKLKIFAYLNDGDFAHSFECDCTDVCFVLEREDDGSFTGFDVLTDRDLERAEIKAVANG